MTPPSAQVKKKPGLFQKKMSKTKMTVKDLSILVEKMKQNSDEKDCIIKTLEDKMSNLQNWVQEMYAHLTKKGQESDQQNFKNCQILEKRLTVIEEKMVEPDKNTNSVTEVDLKCRNCEIVCENKKGLKMHILALHPSEFTCKFCDQLFETSLKYELHLKTHDEVEKIKCDICNQSFYMKWRLRKHKQQHQLTNVKYCHYFNNGMQCDYSEIGCMFNHQEAPICKNGKFCKRRLCQFRHILKCKSCDFTSSSTKTLKDHQVQSHEVTNSVSAVHNCDLCDYTSNTEDGINNHRTATHKTIASTIEVTGCQEKDFDNSEDEDDDGPYDCNHCERNNVQSVYGTIDFNDLIRHIQNDHGLNTYWGPLSS